MNAFVARCAGTRKFMTRARQAGEIAPPAGNASVAHFRQGDTVALRYLHQLIRSSCAPAVRRGEPIDELREGDEWCWHKNVPCKNCLPSCAVFYF